MAPLPKSVTLTGGLASYQHRTSLLRAHADPDLRLRRNRYVSRRSERPPAPGVPCQVVATWQPHVYTTQDPAHRGADTPTLVGRVYLFGPEIKYPMTGDGGLVVDLYECAAAPGTAAAGAVPLEEFRYDPVTLRKFLRRDAIGWGYTVPFMWSTYRPDITRVQMKVRYEPAKGAPLYAEGGPMSIDNPGVGDAGESVGKAGRGGEVNCLAATHRGARRRRAPLWVAAKRMGMCLRRPPLAFLQRFALEDAAIRDADGGVRRTDR